MKTQNSIAISKSIFLGILATMMVVLLASCTKKVSFLTSSVVPAARGAVKVDQDRNKNYVIHLELENLAEASRLTPPKKTYVVWMTADRNETKNIGQIDTSTKAFSKNLKASFESTSAAKPTKVFITAEDDASIQYPSGQTVLTTSNF